MENKVILLVGETGSGKSSIANLLSRSDDLFMVGHGVERQTFEPQIERLSNGATIIDTMGLLDTKDTAETTRKKITQAVIASREGVDVILFVCQQGRFKIHNYITFRTLVDSIFGEECLKNMIFVLSKAQTDHVIDQRCAEAWILEQCRLGVVTYSADDDNYDEDQQQQKQEVVNDITQFDGFLKATKLTGAQRFKIVLDSCGGRVAFVDMPPHTVSQKIEEANREVRHASLNNLLRQIESLGSPPKYISAFAREAQHRYDEEMRRLKRQHEEAKDAAVRAEVEARMARMKTEHEAVLRQNAEKQVENLSKKMHGFFARLGKGLDQGFGFLARQCVIQ